MPVTAKLSRKFYERLGDDIASELVDWFNAVDLTYQTQLRELNDLNWERFKSHLDSALGISKAEHQGEMAGFRQEIHSEFAEFREGVRSEFVDFREGVRSEMTQFREEIRPEIAELRQEILSGIADLRVDFRAEQNKLLKWMVICFSSFFVGLGGLIIGLATFLRG